MIRNNKFKTLVSSAIILLPAVFGIIMWDELPDEMISHTGIQGTPDAVSPKAFMVFGLPLVFLILHLFSLWITGKDPNHKKQTPKATGMVFRILPAASLFVNSLMYFTAFEMNFNPMVPLVLFLAFLFIYMGNYMPKCKQNAYLGIKIKWTLENAENWRATHRFSGKVWFICGLIMIPCILLPEKYAPYLLIGIILPVAILPLVYSYLYYRKQVKQGSYDTSGKLATQLPKGYKLVTVILLVAMAVILPVFMRAGNIDFNMTDTALEIDADFYQDISVKYEDMDDAEFREVTADGVRASGFGSFKLLMGKFKNDEFGYYTRYTYYDDTGCVVITVGEEKLVIAGKTLTETRVLYEELIEKIN